MQFRSLVGSLATLLVVGSMALAKEERRSPLPPTVVLLGFTSLFTDVGTEMIFPLLPVFKVRVGARDSQAGMSNLILHEVAGHREVDLRPANHGHGDPDDDPAAIDHRAARIARIHAAVDLHLGRGAVAGFADRGDG